MFNQEYNSIDGSVSSMTVVPGLGGYLSFCNEEVKKKKPKKPCDKKKADDGVATITTGIGPVSLSNSDNGRTCLNIELGMESPFNVDFTSGHPNDIFGK